MQEDLVYELSVLKKSYELELITKDEYDEYRLKILDNWVKKEGEDLVRDLSVLKKSYDSEFITKDEYDQYRLKMLDNLVSKKDEKDQQESKSFWRRMWDKACEIGNKFLKSIIQPILDRIKLVIEYFTVGRLEDIN